MATRTLLVAAALTVVAVPALLAAPDAVRAWQHPRDVAAYEQYVRTFVGGWASSADPGGPERDEQWVTEHPAEVLAAGDAACAWLAQRPTAPDDAAVESFALLTQYAPIAAHVDGLSELGLGRSTVVAGAWEYLCWAERERATSPFQGD